MRNTHTHFSVEYTGLGKKDRRNEAKKVLRAYTMWIFSKIAAGERVTLQGVGTIHGKLRKGRTGVGVFKSNQPGQFVLKFKPSKEMKPHLVRLALENPNAFKL